MKRNADVVILAGSGRSGTTWLGCILNSYEKAEYFYEICAYPELQFNSPNIVKVKYPLTYWLPKRHHSIDRLERKILTQVRNSIKGTEWIDRTLRINPPHEFKKSIPTVNLFKIVSLFSFALDLDSIRAGLGNRLKIIHLIRNPYAQLMSELRIDARDPEKSKKHFRKRLTDILENQALVKYHGITEHYKEASWIEQMALVWRISNELMLEVSQENICRIVYEDFARNPLYYTEKMFSFLRWNLSEQTREFVFQTSNISESSAGLFSIKKNADESINRWKKEISPTDYQLIRNLIKDSILLDLWKESDLVLDLK